MEQGIDVSRYQGKVDWKAAAAAGITFAVVRAGYGQERNQEDPYFAANMEGAAAAGLAVGCYWFSYAADTAQARQEAETCLEVLGERRPALGVWFDQEYVPAILALDNAQRTAIVKAFLARIRESGRTAGLYCSADWLKNRLETEQLRGENLWTAQYAPRLDVPLPVCLWQYTGSGRADGVEGTVDRDILYAMPAAPAAALRPAAVKKAAAVQTLRRGSRGTAVRALQTALLACGADPGRADGIFGVKTERAVRTFQKQEGLAADGAAGEKTWAKLAEKTAGR